MLVNRLDGESPRGINPQMHPDHKPVRHELALGALELAYAIGKKTDILNALLSLGLLQESIDAKTEVFSVIVREAHGSHELIRQEASAVIKSLKMSETNETKLNQLVQRLLT